MSDMHGQIIVVLKKNTCEPCDECDSEISMQLERASFRNKLGIWVDVERYRCTQCNNWWLLVVH